MKTHDFMLRDKPEDIYAHIFNLASVMLSISSIRDGHFIEVNEACLPTLGYSREEMIGKTSFELGLFSNPDDRVKLLNILEQDGKVRNQEIPLRAKDGRILNFLFSADKMTFKGENCWLVEIVDITERKVVEYALQDTARRLADTIIMLQLVLDTIPVRIFWKDTDLKYLGCNLSFARDAGRSFPEDLIGDTDDHMAWAEQAVLYRADDILVIKSGQPRIAYEEPQTTPDGRKIWLRTSKAPLRDSNGKTIGVLGTYEDITEQKTHEEERILLIKQLRQTNADLEQFASSVSHDLQEPLRMVAGFAGLLKKRYHGKIDAEADKYISYAVDGVVRMQNLVSDILKLARAGINRRKPFLIDSGKALEDALRNLEQRISENDAIISMDVMPYIRFELMELCEVFQNLIANALKFGSKDRRLFIHIGAGELENEWEFSVSDNGIGMESKDLTRIFMPLERLHDHVESDGSGIGLTICKKIIEHYGGRIWASSLPRQGSTFFFTVPKKPLAEFQPDPACSPLSPLD
jgi:hypothetical protein